MVETEETETTVELQQQALPVHLTAVILLAPVVVERVAAELVQVALLQVQPVVVPVPVPQQVVEVVLLILLEQHLAAVAAAEAIIFQVKMVEMEKLS